MRCFLSFVLLLICAFHHISSDVHSQNWSYKWNSLWYPGVSNIILFPPFSCVASLMLYNLFLADTFSQNHFHASSRGPSIFDIPAPPCLCFISDFLNWQIFFSPTLFLNCCRKENILYVESFRPVLFFDEFYLPFYVPSIRPYNFLMDEVFFPRGREPGWYAKKLG